MGVSIRLLGIGLAAALASQGSAAEFDEYVAEVDALVTRLAGTIPAPTTEAELKLLRAFVAGTCAREGARFHLYSGWGPFRRLTGEGRAVMDAAAGFSGALDHLALDRGDEQLVGEAEFRLFVLGRYHEAQDGRSRLRSFGYLQREAEEVVRQAVMLDLASWVDSGGPATIERLVRGGEPSQSRPELATFARRLRGRLTYVESYGGFDQANPARRDSKVQRARAAFDALERWLRGEAVPSAAAPASAGPAPADRAPQDDGDLLGT